MAGGFKQTPFALCNCLKGSWRKSWSWLKELYGGCPCRIASTPTRDNHKTVAKDMADLKVFLAPCSPTCSWHP